MAEPTDRKPSPSVPHFAVFISSPSGLDAEKAIVADEIKSLSDRGTLTDAPGLTATAWPDGIAAGVASYGQSVINRQTSQFDILVCLVGARMGTPTPRANSGTEEEFDRAMEAMLSDAPVQILLFFSNM